MCDEFPFFLEIFMDVLCIGFVWRGRLRDTIMSFLFFSFYFE